MKLRILIADDEAPARYGLKKALSTHDVIEASNGQEAIDAVKASAPNLVLLDLNMPIIDGLSVLRQLAGHAPLPEIIVVSANDSVDAAVEAMRLGASDYITKPYEVSKIRGIATRLLERLSLQSQVDELRQQLDRGRGMGSLIGTSPPMRKLFDQIDRAARSSIDILIRGETGTGKELIARELHARSNRQKSPFIAVNTAAINDSLIESELFGHTKGAFTGADGDRKGFFEQADGGTLFLDEIGDMPLSAQAKMLRVLQERVIQPVGSSKSKTIDVRVISATHQDLEAAIDSKAFRADLFFRLKGVELQIPPLRQRREDILVLADHFLSRSSSIDERTPLSLEPAAVDRLLSYCWPGNVRELEQAMLAAATMAEGDTITARDLPLAGGKRVDETMHFTELAQLPLTEAKSLLVESFERFAIEKALETAHGNVSAAARQLGIHRQNLQQKISQLGLKKAEAE